MLMLSRHRLFLRCVSLLTALTFLPNSVQAWYFMPQVQTVVLAAEEGPRALAADKMAELETDAEAPAPLSDEHGVQLSDIAASAKTSPELPETEQVADARRFGMSSDAWHKTVLETAEAASVNEEKKPIIVANLSESEEVPTALAEPSDLQARLTTARNLQNSGQMMGAFAATVSLADAYPDYRLPEVDAASQVAAQIVATSTERDLQDIEAALPSLWASVSTAYAKERVARFYELRAEAAGEGTSLWKTYLTKLAEAHWRIIIENSKDVIAYFKINTFLKSSRALGTEDEAYSRIHALVDTLEPCPAAFGGWDALAQDARDRHAMGESTLYFYNMLSVAERGGLDAVLNDPNTAPSTKAARLYSIGYGYYCTHQLARALEQFEYVTDNFTELPARAQWVEDAPVLLSGLVGARVTAELNAEDPYQGILAYNNFIQKNAKTALAAQAMLEMGGLYMLAGDFGQAADTYLKVISAYPGTEAAGAAEGELDYVVSNLLAPENSAKNEKIGNEDKVRQLCGPLALKKWFALRGVDTSVGELARIAGTDSDGSSMTGLVQAAEAKGLDLIGVEAANLDEVATPLIAFVDSNHFVLVRSLLGDQVAISDMGKTETFEPRSAFEKRWNGKVLVSERNTEKLALLDVTSMSSTIGGCALPSTYMPISTTVYFPSPGPDHYPMPSPADGSAESKLPGAPIGGGTLSWLQVASPGVNPMVSGFDSALVLNETDASLPVAGPAVSFSRVYINEQGFHRAEFTDISKPWSNTIGAGWTHSLNMHLKAGATATTAVTYYDETGTPRLYNYSSADANYYYYLRPDGFGTRERGNLLTRSKANDQFTLYNVGEVRYNFSSPTGDANHFARLESVQDISGNATALYYSGANGTGKLTKVTPPTGDARHLELFYAGNLITKVSRMKNSTPLDITEYFYNASNLLTKVRDNSSNDVQYWYDTASGAGVVTKIRDKAGKDTNIAWTFTTYGGVYQAYKIQVENAVGLSTIFDRSTSTNVCTITNSYGGSQLNKIVHSPVTGDTSRSADLKYYKDVSTYTQWTYGYNTTYGDPTKATFLDELGGTTTYATHTFGAIGRFQSAAIGTGGTETYAYASSSSLYPTKVTNPVGEETRYNYDSYGRLTSTVLPTSSYPVQYAYSASGQVSSVTNEVGESATFAYDALGWLTLRTQPDGSTTSMEYDDYGAVTRVVESTGEVTEYEYSGTGCSCAASRLTKTTNPNGLEEQYTYDVNGNTITTVTGLGNVEIGEYDSINRATKAVVAGGELNFEYNALGQITSQNLLGQVFELEFNHVGRVTTQIRGINSATNVAPIFHQTAWGNEIDSRGNSLERYYDAAFRVTKVHSPMNRDTRFYRDALGRITKEGAGPSGTEDVVEYAFDDTLHQLTSVRFDGSNTIQYYYDSHGRQTKATDWMGGNGVRTSFDTSGRITRITDYDDTYLEYSYNSRNQVTTLTDFHGNTISYSYNELGKLSTMTAPGGKTWTVLYDSNSMPTTVSYPNGMTSIYLYDEYKRLTGIQHKDGASFEQSFSYDLDVIGRITRKTELDGSYWLYSYDEVPRLTGAERFNSSETIHAQYAYTYDATNNLLTKEAPWYDDFQDGDISGWSGSTTYFTVTGGVMKNTSNSTVREIYLSESDADHDLSFDYIRYSNTGRADIVLRTIGGNDQVYLELNPGNIRLRQVDGGTLSTLGTYTTTVAEDTWYRLRAVLDGSSVSIYWGEKGGEFNEILSVTTTELMTSRAAYFKAQANSEHGFDNVKLIAGTRATVTAMAYDATNALTSATKDGATRSFYYDGRGRLTSRIEGSYSASYSYAFGGKLTAVSSNFPDEGNVTYSYDSAGLLRSRTANGTTVKYRWADGRIVNKEDNSGTLLQMFIGGEADVEGSNPASGVYRFYLKDRLGSAASVWDSSKQILGVSEFEPFGGEYSLVGMPLDEYAVAYAGLAWDKDAQLCYATHRRYSPETAQWITKDPLDAGDAGNQYAYPRNPVSQADPSGLISGCSVTQAWIDFAKPAQWSIGSFHVQTQIVGKGWRSALFYLGVIPGLGYVGHPFFIYKASDTDYQAYKFNENGVPHCQGTDEQRSTNYEANVEPLTPSTTGTLRNLVKPCAAASSAEIDGCLKANLTLAPNSSYQDVGRNSLWGAYYRAKACCLEPSHNMKFAQKLNSNPILILLAQLL